MREARLCRENQDTKDEEEKFKCASLGGSCLTNTDCCSGSCSTDNRCFDTDF